MGTYQHYHYLAAQLPFVTATAQGYIDPMRQGPLPWVCLPFLALCRQSSRIALLPAVVNCFITTALCLKVHCMLSLAHVAPLQLSLAFFLGTNRKAQYRAWHSAADMSEVTQILIVAGLSLARTLSRLQDRLWGDTSGHPRLEIAV